MNGLPDPKGSLLSSITLNQSLWPIEVENIIRMKEGEKAWSTFKVGTSKHRKPLQLYFILFFRFDHTTYILYYFAGMTIRPMQTLVGMLFSME